MILAIDVGGTKTAFALFDTEGNICFKEIIPTNPCEGAEALLHKIKNAINGAEVSAVGIGAPGPLSVKEGEIIFVATMGWKNVPLRALSEQIFGCKTVLYNDCDAAAAGEYLFGAGHGVTEMAYLSLSTGVGGGLIVGGKLFVGDGNVADFGHLRVATDEVRICPCGKVNCAELYASGTSVAKGYADLSGKEVSTAEVFRLYQQGDPVAKKVVKTAAEMLGQVLQTVSAVFAPQCFVIGGGMSAAIDHLLPYIPDVFAKRIRKFSLDGWQGVYGAYALACGKISTIEH